MAWQVHALRVHGSWAPVSPLTGISAAGVLGPVDGEREYAAPIKQLECFCARRFAISIIVDDVVLAVGHSGGAPWLGVVDCSATGVDDARITEWEYTAAVREWHRWDMCRLGRRPAGSGLR